MAEKLFGNHIPPACRYCSQCRRVITSRNQAICKKYGVVQGDYKCRHYDYDPLWRVPMKPQPLQTFTGTEFSLDLSDLSEE